jgi:hypothetical protein
LAKIHARLGSLARECLVTDVSDGGVRLFSERMELPSEFVIQFADAEQSKRECRVVWRLGPEVGAEFIDAKLTGFGKRVADTSR